MSMLEKQLESLDAVISTMDQTMAEDPDTILTEGQVDEEIDEQIDQFIEDVENVMSRWSPDQQKYFEERVAIMLEESEPELLEERNIVRLDRNSVFNQLVGLFSLVIARRRRDPAFALYKKGSAIRRKAKQNIKRKYSSRAVPLARKMLRKRRFKS